MIRIPKSFWCTTGRGEFQLSVELPRILGQQIGRSDAKKFYGKFMCDNGAENTGNLFGFF